jgi:hypothetical protein
VLRYYGSGNDTPNLESRDYYRVEQDRFELKPALVVPLGCAVGAASTTAAPSSG